jgi:hypothetical protein
LNGLVDKPVSCVISTLRKIVHALLRGGSKTTHSKD